MNGNCITHTQSFTEIHTYMSYSHTLHKLENEKQPTELRILMRQLTQCNNIVQYNITETQIGSWAPTQTSNSLQQSEFALILMWLPKWGLRVVSFHSKQWKITSIYSTNN